MRLSADGQCAALRDKANYIRLSTAPIPSLHPNHLLYRGRLLVLGVLRDGFDCAGSGGTRNRPLSHCPPLQRKILVEEFICFNIRAIRKCAILAKLSHSLFSFAYDKEMALVFVAFRDGKATSKCSTF